jgi:hypothetical protein
MKSFEDTDINIYTYGASLEYDPNGMELEEEEEYDQEYEYEDFETYEHAGTRPSFRYEGYDDSEDDEDRMEIIRMRERMLFHLPPESKSFDDHETTPGLSSTDDAGDYDTDRDSSDSDDTVVASHSSNSPTKFLPLPLEVLRIIFAYVSPYYDSTKTSISAEMHSLLCLNHRFWRSDGPWALSQVCHSWREVALSMPSLWATFRGGFICNPLRMYLTLLRSQNLPLVFQYRNYSTIGGLDPIFTLLASVPHRWLAVSMEINVDQLGQIAFPSVCDTFHQLEFVQFNVLPPPRSCGKKIPQRIDILSGPLFNLRGVVAPFKVARIAIPFRQLHICSLSRINTKDELLLLQIAPNITYLSLSVSDELDVVPKEPIFLPYLRELKVKKRDYLMKNLTLLPWLITPNLKDVTVPWDGLPELLERCKASKCTLTALRLFYFPDSPSSSELFTEEEVTKALSHPQFKDSVTTLQISAQSYSEVNPLLMALTFRRGKHLLPKLKTLIADFEGRIAVGFKPDALIETIESRMERNYECFVGRDVSDAANLDALALADVSWLKKLELKFAYFDDEFIEGVTRPRLSDIVKRLQNEGLDIWWQPVKGRALALL